MKLTTPSNFDDYIAGLPKEVQNILKSVRQTIKKAVPAAEECISYGMPAFKYNGKALIYFAGYKSHIGLYATPSGHESFAKELSKYKKGKGSVQFPIDQPMPLGLIAKMAAFRMKQLDKNENNFLAELSAPASRALRNRGIGTLQQLAKYSVIEILNLHGIGKTAIPKLEKALKQKGLSFKL